MRKYKLGSIPGACNALPPASKIILCLVDRHCTVYSFIGLLARLITSSAYGRTISRICRGKTRSSASARRRTCASEGRRYGLAGPASIRPAKEATSTIPIVMANDADPVGSGVVASLALPGGNITGLSNLAPEMGGKRLELLKEIVPRLARVAVEGLRPPRAPHKCCKRDGARRWGVPRAASISRRTRSQGD